MLQPSTPEVNLPPVEKIIPNYQGEDLKMLLVGASSHAQEQAELMRSQTNGFLPLWAIKASRRLITAAETKISTDPKTPTTYNAIISDPKSFGIEPKDLAYLKEWILSKNLVENSIEPKYGVMRLENFRKQIITHHLIPNHSDGSASQELIKKSGSLVCLDVVGLKSFNEISDAVGDQALKKVAEFLKVLYAQPDLTTEFPQLMIGRRGDEFYLFFPNQTAGDISQVISKSLREKQDELTVSYPSQNELIYKPIVTYWRVAGNVDVNNFDASISLLDESIESAKLQVVQNILSQITENNHTKPVAKYAQLLQLLASKRISLNIIHALIKSSVETFTAYVNLSGEKEKEILNRLLEQFNSEQIKTELNNILKQIAYDAENPETHIITQ